MYEFTYAPKYGVYTTMGVEYPLRVLILAGVLIVVVGIIIRASSGRKMWSRIGVSLALIGVGVGLIGAVIQKPTQVVDTASLHQEVEKDGMSLPEENMLTSWANLLNGPSTWEPSPCLMLENRTNEECADPTRFYPVDDSKGERFYVRATASGELWYLDEKGTYHKRDQVASVVSAEKIKESVEETTALEAVNVEKEEYTYEETRDADGRHVKVTGEFQGQIIEAYAWYEGRDLRVVPVEASDVIEGDLRK